MNSEKQLIKDTIKNQIYKAHYTKILTIDEINDLVTKLLDELRAFEAGE